MSSPPQTATKRAASPGSPEIPTSSKRAKDENGEPVRQEGGKAGTDGEDVIMKPAPASAGLPPVPESLPATPAKPVDPPAQQISMRCLIVTQDASIIIGKAGAHVNEIREKSSARVTISESIPGNPERILTVSGALDAVAKAFGLIVRRINDEPFDVPSVPGSRAVTIKFIIPNSRMGSVIGKGGAKIKEIQEASGARLNASEAMLPGSTERVLSVSGVADAVHIAVYYIGTILLEYQERNPGGAATGSYRQMPPAGGRDSYVPGGGYGGAPYGGGGGGGGGRSYDGRGPPPPLHGMGGGGGMAPPNGANMPGAQTQQIFIPNALVGAIIGKGGAKINEIRQQSQCQIRITDPGTGIAPDQPTNPEERLVTITGQPANINIAVQLLYSRLEAEKAKTG